MPHLPYGISLDQNEAETIISFLATGEEGLEQTIADLRGRLKLVSVIESIEAAMNDPMLSAKVNEVKEKLPLIYSQMEEMADTLVVVSRVLDRYYPDRVRTQGEKDTVNSE